MEAVNNSKKELGKLKDSNEFFDLSILPVVDVQFEKQKDGQWKVKKTIIAPAEIELHIEARGQIFKQTATEDLKFEVEQKNKK
jgi:hypothetical protein